MSRHDEPRIESLLEELVATDEDRRLLEQERLVLAATELICRAMQDEHLSRAELARRIGTSRANITQLLSGSRNLTVRTLSDLAWACGGIVELDFVLLNEEETALPATIPLLRLPSLTTSMLPEGEPNALGQPILAA